MQITVLTSTIIAALSAFVAATPTSVVTNLVTIEQFKDWLNNTDAEITYIGEPIGDLSKRKALDTTVVYCSGRVDNVCGGRCTVYHGGPTCLDAPDTNCLFATSNVGFCAGGGCGGGCNQLSTCGVRLDDEFCFTPGTSSILVGAF